MRKTARSILVLLTIGTFVSARQAASRPEFERPDRDDAPAGRVESVFLAHDKYVGGSGSAPAFGPLPVRSMRAAFSDTLEMYEIELKPEKDSGISAKKIAALVVAGAFVAYALYLFLDPGESEAPPENGGKDVPGPFIRIPLSR